MVMIFIIWFLSVTRMFRWMHELVRPWSFSTGRKKSQETGDSFARCGKSPCWILRGCSHWTFFVAGKSNFDEFWIGTNVRSSTYLTYLTHATMKTVSEPSPRPFRRVEAIWQWQTHFWLPCRGEKFAPWRWNGWNGWNRLELPPKLRCSVEGFTLW